MKQVFTLLLLFFSLATFAQKGFQGKATYMSKTTVDLDAWGGNQMSEQRKKQIMARMKNFLEKTYTLDFNQTESNFKEEAKLDAPGAGRGRGFRFGGSAGGSVYKNTKEGKVIESLEFFGKKFLVTEKMNPPQWELGVETKKIGQYTCYKATMVKVNNEFDWTVFRRNRNNQKKDSTKTEQKDKERKILVTAWYTPEIPVSTGPDDHWGLPGLILELNAGRTTMLCTEIVLNPEEKVEIKAPKKGDKVTREEYNAIVKKKTEEMRERFKSRGRGRGRF
ncbi:GLPGLI family protein [Pseudotenacibaculum sp. MALMAid0570]|uniref:GLPGLI family protein n=1 Tax=Pseudotenacibaculum sp. MALMAid0570 TaxID=3143938 RepID=UPI0032DE5A32